MNLNASHLPVLVKTLTGLAKTGVQVILSSHSLFLLRELMIQLSEPRNAMVQRKFFGMSVPRGERSGVRVSWGNPWRTWDLSSLLKRKSNRQTGI